MSTAIEVLNEFYGYKAFRKSQEDIINEIVKGNDVVAIMPTGGGKSICYQIPTILLNGITIVISPLISLMKDQVDAIQSIGINSAYLNSSLSNSEINEIFYQLSHNEIKILYVAPERLESSDFLNIVSNLEIAQIAIDEAHCVSQWGHDFRSSYKYINKFISLLKKRPIISAFTATATKEVREDIIKLLGLKEPKIFISGFDRENLKIIIEKGVNKKQYIIDYLEKNKDLSGIIYASTRKDVDLIHSLLISKGFSVTKYHAGLGDNERALNQEEFVHDRCSIMIATNAFGMGIDKPNIRFVIHYNMPKNIEGYYQEIGRAGRDGLGSECILLFSPGDVQTQKYIIDTGTLNSIRKINELNKLQTMVDLVYSKNCYRKYILNYFGEEATEECGKCSNCETDREIVDKTLDAQKVLSCIYKMKRGYGIGVLVDVLRGSENKKVRDLGFNILSTYGIMKEYSKEDLKDFINTLISHEYIDYIGEYPVAKLNNKSVEVLKGAESVFFKEIKIQKSLNNNNYLFNILKELRIRIAAEEKVPPYIVLGDSTLKELSIRMPVNKEQFIDINGVGKAKVEKYGEIFIDEIKDYIKTNNLIVQWKYYKDKLENKKNIIEVDGNLSNKSKKSYIKTIDMVKKDNNIKVVAKERELSLGTIFSHIQQYISEGNKIDFYIDFSEIISEDEEKQILDVIDMVGCNKLKAIKEKLPKNIEYDQIKAVVLKKIVN